MLRSQRSLASAFTRAKKKEMNKTKVNGNVVDNRSKE